MSDKFGLGIRIISKASILSVGSPLRWRLEVRFAGSWLGNRLALPGIRVMYLFSLFSVMFFLASLLASLFSSFEYMWKDLFCCFSFFATMIG